MKHTIRRATYWAMQLNGALAVKRWRAAKVGNGWAAVIVFHRVTDEVPEDGTTVSPERFRCILRLLSRSYHVISCADLVSRVRENRSFTGREVLITFDDGYLDNYEYAAPLLREFRMPACFFLTVGFIGSDRNFWWDEQHGRNSRVMSWAQVREMSGLGFEFGCHTWSHPDLGKEPIQSTQSELLKAKSLMEDEMGQSANHFAYPFGGRENIRDDWLDAIRNAGFVSSFCGFEGLVRSTDDPYWIPRMGASHHRTLTDLRIEMDNAW